MAEKLTPQQQMAVENRGGRLLVSAAAGSGKTKVLIDRLMGYINDTQNPANIDDFLMITFTTAAASELRGKIAAKLGQLVAQQPENAHLHRQLQRLYLAKISTVHSFCSEILREYAYQLNLPGDFRVADEVECTEIRSRVMEKLLNDAYATRMGDDAFRAFVDTQGLGRDDRAVPEIVQNIYAAAQCHLNPEQWLDRCLEMMHADENAAEETVYGAFLMDRLKHWLDSQIPMLELCQKTAAEAKGLEKPASVLALTLAGAKKLRECETWDEICEIGAIKEGNLVFPRKDVDLALKEKLSAARKSFKDELKKRLAVFSNSSQQVMEDMNASLLATQGLVNLVRDFGKAYEMAKRANRVLDYGDLEHKMLDLLYDKSRQNLRPMAAEIGKRFREVLVDEYQDSNEVQDAIYSALTSQNKNLFMVGDVKQSIYQFRLADPGIFLAKYHAFAPAEKAAQGEDRKVVLSQNFRSSKGVLEGCNDIFRTCMCPEVGGMFYGPDEALYEGLPHVAMPTPETELCCIDVQHDTYTEEANFVAGHISELLKSGVVRDGDQLRPVKPEDIVILLRAPGSAGIYFQRALDAAGIRYATGGGVNLLETEEVGTLRALLQVIQNPRLDIPLVSVLSSRVIGFTADDLAGIRAADKASCFYDALCKSDLPKAKEFLAKLQELRSCVRKYGLTQLVEQVLISTSFEEIFSTLPDGQLRHANIQSFFQLASSYEASGNRDLGRFLEHLESMEEKDLFSPGQPTAAGCVTIMSIHKSKGLEFPVVYLCNLSRGFNKESLKGAVLSHTDLGIGLSAVDHKNRLRYPTIAKRAIAQKVSLDNVSEELRVLYVAVTRAKDRLIMTYASNKLAGDLATITQALEMGGKQAFIEEASCLGDWVLLTAMQRTEAGALFELGGNPSCAKVSEIPWEITVNRGTQPIVDSESDAVAEQLPPSISSKLGSALAFSYPHEAATQAASKQTATGRKGRVKDEEAAENTQVKTSYRQWRKPSFAEIGAMGKDYGNAVHRFMQYVDYPKCGDAKGVTAEIQRLTANQFLTEQQGKLIDPQKIVAFFDSELGEKVRCGEVIREFKFSILEDGAAFDSSISGEKVLLQGVVDCALLEADGITVLDFKTDYVTEDTLPQKVELYRPQVQAYASALERIYQKSVKASFLYFFHLNRFVTL